LVAARPPPKPRIGPVNDPLEQEADRIADALVSDRPIGAIGAAPPDTAQRKCAQCEIEDAKTLRRKPLGTNGSAAPAAGAASAIASGGAQLSPAERAYFEPRFGRDLSGVRIHTDRQAAAAARDIDARAFTLGRDIAFAPGEYRPETQPGRHLMAHELAHTLQQDGATIRRASYATAASPAWATGTVVPPGDRERVDEAMAIIDEVVNRPASFSECHDLFTEHCPGGTGGTLASTWQQAVVWRVTSPSPTSRGRGAVNGNNIGYTGVGYDQGAEGLAGTLLHEAGHNCGITGTRHWRAEQIKNYCINPRRNEFAISGGGYLGGEGAILMLSYRRFLGDLAYGRLRFTLGADLNAIGGIVEASDESIDQPASLRSPREFGSLMAGGQIRLGGWGGSRYGGIGLRLETGFGAGRFATSGGEPSTAIAPGVVVQIGPRAEFLIKSGDAHVTPVSFSAAYRLMQPINQEARALHAFMGSVEFRF
jgi:hypothetical protein